MQTYGSGVAKRGSEGKDPIEKEKSVKKNEGGNGDIELTRKGRADGFSVFVREREIPDGRWLNR